MVMARDASHRWALRLGLFGIFAIALLARSLGFDHVFQDDGTVVFTASDAFYHVRRILFGIENFPLTLQFDPCLNWPDGSAIPHPPLYDQAAAGLARLWAPVPATTVLAWLPAFLGALAVFPVYALGRSLHGAGLGLAASLLYATLPIAVQYASVGNPDHHAATALAGACLVWLYAAFLDPACRGGRLWAVALGLAIARLALLGSWHGSALYLAPGEAALVIYCVAANRRDLFLAQATSALLTLALVAPWVFVSLTPKAGTWSATELSALHLLGLLAVAVLCLVGLGLSRWLPRRTTGMRLLHIGATALGLGLLALAFPGIRDGLEPGLAFVSKRDAWGNHVMEQLPLFFLHGEWSGRGGEIRMGYFAYLLPLVPLAFAGLARDPARSAVGIFLFAWSLFFVGLTLYQLRFANDVAPVACAGFALLLLQLAQWLARHTPLGPQAARACVIALGFFLAWPGIDLSLRPYAATGLDYLAGQRPPGDRALMTLAGTQVRFAQQVRAATPAGPGCGPGDEASQRPSYGILAHPSLGHVLHQVAGKATPADPFGPYIGDANYRSVVAFFQAESEAQAVATARALQSPFVATAADVGGPGDERSIRYRLQEEDGSATPESPHLEHFRLVTEGPRGGVPLSAVFDDEAWSEIPYKLFEIVPGAIIRIPASPGERVEATLGVATQAGRRLIFRARAEAGPDGFAQLRVPYASGARGEISTSPAYQWESTAGRGWAKVPEVAVREGLAVPAGVYGDADPEGSGSETPERS